VSNNQASFVRVEAPPAASSREKPPVGVAVVGAGYWGGKLVGEYLLAERRSRLRLLKVCDASVAALGGLLLVKETTRVGQERLTQDFNELLDDPEISAVHIATPNETHYAVAKAALEAGKNVLVEKPMSLSSREAYELVDRAAQLGLTLEVGHLFRFNRALQVAREMLRNGDIGKVFYVRVQWTDQGTFPNREIIFDLGPHPIDILNQLLGTWPQDVTGVGRAYRNSQTHNDVAYVFAEYPNDVFAHIELSWLHPTKVRNVSIVGAEGTLVVDCLNQKLTQHYLDKTYEIPITPSNTIAGEIEHFIDRVSVGDAAIDDSGARNVEFLEKVRRSLWERNVPHTPEPSIEKQTEVESLNRKIQADAETRQ